jgi:lipopolysaccharide export system permease protein
LKKLDLYVVREMVVPFLIGTVMVVLMFQANLYIALAKNLTLANVPPEAVYQYILYMTPSFLVQTLPVGTALGASLAMSRLSRESELTAMRAAGVRILRVIVPVMLFGLMVAVGNFLLVERVVPPAMKRATPLGFQIGALGFAPDVKTNTIIQLGRVTASFGTVFRQGDDLQIQEILLIERPEPGVTYLTTADKATYTNGQWRLEDCLVREVRGIDIVSIESKGEVIIHEKIVTSDLFNPPSAEELTLAQLEQSIEAAKKVGASTKRLEVQWHEKFAIPVACMIFALVAPVFAILFARTGGFMGVLLSIVMVMLYYNAFVISTQILSKIDPVPAWLAAWLPNILFAVLGLVAIRRLE